VKGKRGEMGGEGSGKKESQSMICTKDIGEG
jgi:hypothetical protein